MYLEEMKNNSGLSFDKKYQEEVSYIGQPVPEVELKDTWGEMKIHHGCDTVDWSSGYPVWAWVYIYLPKEKSYKLVHVMWILFQPWQVLKRLCWLIWSGGWSYGVQAL